MPRQVATVSPNTTRHFAPRTPMGEPPAAHTAKTWPVPGRAKLSENNGLRLTSVMWLSRDMGGGSPDLGGGVPTRVECHPGHAFAAAITSRAPGEEIPRARTACYADEAL